MRKTIFLVLMVAAVAISGCAQMDGDNDPSPVIDQAAVEEVSNESVNITSGGMTYPAYLATPAGKGKWPGVVMIHSFNGLEPGYISMADQFAMQGYVVLAIQWQTFNRSPSDAVVAGLVDDSVAYLKSREDVEGDRLGLTGFCAGGRYTMLLLPQMNQSFRSGVAWYGFPYSGADNQSRPVDVISQLDDPMLIIHGTYDQPSKISEIYQYATELNATGKYFEMKVYQAEPHGFMIEDGQLSKSSQARDAFWQMISFFDRTLK